MSYNGWSTKQIKKQIHKSSKAQEKEEVEILYSILNNECDAFSYDTTKEEKELMDSTITNEYKYFMEDIDLFSNTKVKRHINYLDEIGMSSKELLSFTHDYFKQFDPNWYKIFMSVFKDRKHNLIIGSKGNSTIYIPSQDYSYIKVEKKDSIEDYFNLIHEYTHTVVDRMKYRHDYLCGYPFVELPSLLNELLLCDYLKEVYIGLDKDIKSYFNSLIRQTVAYAKRISNYYYKGIIDKDYMVKYISYVIPMMEVIELYNVFLSDKEKGLFILNNIIMMDEVPNYLEYTKRLGLIPNQNVNNIINKFNKN